jgi:hypothetical protein
VGLLAILTELSLSSFVDAFVRGVAIWEIAKMENSLIITGQDGTFLLPVAFIIGVLARGKISDLLEACIFKPR